MAMRQPIKPPSKAGSSAAAQVELAKTNTMTSQGGNNSSGSGGRAPGGPAGYVERPMVSRGLVPGGVSTPKTLYRHDPVKPAPVGGGGFLERRNVDLDGASAGARGIDTTVPPPRNGLLGADAASAPSRR